MKSIIYVLSPLPMIDFISTFCQSLKMTIERSTDIEDQMRNGGGDNSVSSKNSTLSVPMTLFQKQILWLNTETIFYHLREPFRRERVTEFYITPPGRTSLVSSLLIFLSEGIPSKASRLVCDFSYKDLFQEISVTLFIAVIIRVISYGSVVIHSIDSVLLTKVISAVESLLHPFEMLEYQFCQFLSTIDEFKNWKYHSLFNSRSPFLVLSISLFLHVFSSNLFRWVCLLLLHC